MDPFEKATIKNIRSVFDKFVARYSRLPTETDPDYLEMLRMSKYRILAVPDVSPGKCANCGASKNDGRKYVDFGLQVDWYGAVFLCGHCTRDISLNMGHFEELENKLGLLLAEDERLADLKNQGVELHDSAVNLFKEFEEYYDCVYSLGDNNSSDPTPSVEPTKATIESGTNETKSRATKSTSSSGRKDVRSLADLLNDTGD